MVKRIPVFGEGDPPEKIENWRENFFSADIRFFVGADLEYFVVACGGINVTSS